MRIGSSQKRGLLRSAWGASQSASVSLSDKLESLSSAAAGLFSSGQTIASTSGNGHSVSFSVPGANTPTSPDLVQAYEELISLYSQVQGDIASVEIGIATCGIVQLATNGYVEIFVTSTTNGKTITLQTAQLVITQL